MNERIARRLVIRGHVQGVFFRASMRQEAEALALTGWVRNRRDGTVEALVQGPAWAVEALTKWAHRGPEAAQVERVDVEEAPFDPVERFESRPTG